MFKSKIFLALAILLASTSAFVTKNERPNSNAFIVVSSTCTPATLDAGQTCGLTNVNKPQCTASEGTHLSQPAFSSNSNPITCTGIYWRQ